MYERHDRIVKLLRRISFKMLYGIFVALLFVALLLSAISAKICRDSSSDRMKLASCSFSLAFPMRWRGELNGRLELNVYRGIARANLGRIDAAREDFQTALLKATFNRPGPVLQHGDISHYEVHNPVKFLMLMQKLDPKSPAGRIWREVVAPYRPVTFGGKLERLLNPTGKPGTAAPRRP